MKMSMYLYIMTFWLSLGISSRIYKKHVYNSVTPRKDTEPYYNISVWVKQLHLQQCVIVEIGDKFSGVFIEYRPTGTELKNEVEEYFLGLCDLATVSKWKLCPPAVETERPKECIFQESSESSNQPIRVHRRLCDVTGLAIYGKTCNCSTSIFHGQKLYEVIGFPTCFIPPLPQSICLMGNVCGVYSCRTSTTNKIHTVKCNPQCVGHQPFCESTGPDTTRASSIYSYWSDWTEPFCNDECSNNTNWNGVTHSQALCINKNTGMGAMDCLGPGTNCCPPNVDKCRCYIYEEDGILKLSRELKTKTPIYFDWQQNILSSQDSSLRRVPRESDKKVIKEKYSKKSTQEEGDEVDDVRELEDESDEDIILEDEHENGHQTTEEPEKNDVTLRDIPKPDTKIAIDEMAKDLNQTNPNVSLSKTTRLKYVLFHYELVILCTMLLYLVDD